MASVSNSGLIFGIVPLGIFQLHLVHGTCGAGDLEPLRDLDSRDPDDLSIPDEQWNPVPILGADFTINQKILQFFVVWHSEGLKAIAGATVADREVFCRPQRKLEELGRGPRIDLRPSTFDLRILPALDRDRRSDLGDECTRSSAELYLEWRGRLRRTSQDEGAPLMDELELASHADASDIADR